MEQTKSIVRKAFQERDPWSHKGDHGKLLVVSGSKVFTGAPVMVGMAALRSGVDTVYFIGPERAMNAVSVAYPTFVNMPLDGDYLEKQHLDEIFEFAHDMKVTGMVVGPGLWRNDKTKAAILQIIDGFDIPMVIDADAIRALGADNKLVQGKETVLTPHANEFKDLTGVELNTKPEDRAKIVKEWAKKIGTTILLKGHVDVISDGNRVALNKTGNVYMTKGGFGDMLAGICGALIARRKNRLEPYEVACAAAYINGRAGDLAAKERVEGLMPLDALHKIPDVIREG